MHNTVEFHDSQIFAIACEGNSVRISLNAYVHRWDRVEGRWKGTGWTQCVEILLVDTFPPEPLELPAHLLGGKVIVGDVAYKDLLPLPLSSSGPASVRLELGTGNVIAIKGRDLAMLPTSEAHYVEDLPDDFRPSSLG